MQTTHRMKDGTTILIAEMGDKHLVNVIKLYCRQIEEQANIALGSYTPQDEMLSLFVNQATPEHQKQLAKNKIQELYRLLAWYVLEASLRNLDVAEPLQKAMRRKDRIRSSFTNSHRPLQLDASEDLES